jgi:cyclophilin family peptidyl-prolyl cis-trans isomerase
MLKLWLKQTGILFIAATSLLFINCSGQRNEANRWSNDAENQAGGVTVKAPAPPPEPGYPVTPQPPPDMNLVSNLVRISTKFGDMVIQLDPEVAPKTVENFKKLTSEGFYNGTTFHRIIPNFMIQGGDPLSKNPDQRAKHGTGGPGYTLPAEIKLPHTRGTVATARLGDQVNPKRESSGSQFFINITDNDYLNDQYTVFGKVISGMEVADKIAAQKKDARDNPQEPIPMTISFVQEEKKAQ